MNYNNIKELADFALENFAMSEEVREAFSAIKNEVSESQTLQERLTTVAKWTKAVMDVAHLYDEISKHL